MKFKIRLSGFQFLTLKVWQWHLVGIPQWKKKCTFILHLTAAEYTASKMAQQLHLAKFWGMKRKNSSDIWDHFGFATNEKGLIVDRTKAVCKYCNAELKYQGSTSNLQYHYNNYHIKAVKTHQPSIEDCFGKPKKYSVSSTRQCMLQKCVAEFLIENLVPFNVVESNSFLNLMKQLDPKFNVGTRKTYSDVILPKMYAATGEKVNNILKLIEGVACTTDG